MSELRGRIPAQRASWCLWNGCREHEKQVIGARVHRHLGSARPVSLGVIVLTAVSLLGLSGCSSGESRGTTFFGCEPPFSVIPSTVPPDPVLIERPEFSLAVPTDFVTLDLDSPDLSSAITAAAAGDGALEEFLQVTAASQAGKPGPRIIAGHRRNFQTDNLLLERAPEQLRLGSRDFVEVMKLVVELADFNVGTLNMCDFEHRGDRGRLVSYLLQDNLGGADLVGRVALIESGDDLWVFTSFGSAGKGDEVEQSLSTIVAGFRSTS